MQEENLVGILMKAFSGSASEESRHEGGPSTSDVIATEYMRRIYEGQKRAAREDQKLAFEG
jgi:hypothetical protein